MKRAFLSLMLLGLASTGRAQEPAPGAAGAVAIAVPPLTTPDGGTRGNQMLQVGWEATQVIVSDLQQTQDLVPLKTSRDDYYSYPEVTAPSFPKWRSAGARALVTGFVQSRSDGRLTFGCYVYDVDKGREIVRKGFVITPGEWRRAAHKCAGLAYTAVTGAPGMFDTRIAYVARTDIGQNPVRRIAVMDSDGLNLSYLTTGDSVVLTPRLSPKGNRLAYVSYSGGAPNIHVIDLGSSHERPLLPSDAISFAPRYSPDGSRIAFSMMVGPNSGIYVVGAEGGAPQRLTATSGVDTDPGFSPDGSRIVFESDRGGSQQLYVMNADGTGQRRISFGAGAYASPEWSPDGQWIAFTHRGPEGRRIGIIHPDGTGERLLSSGPTDEGPTWAASSRTILFQRSNPSGQPGLYRISLEGGDITRMTIPQGGSDPDWSGVLD
jgi:TolB protein